MLLRILLALAVPCISGQILTPPNDVLYLGSPCNTPHGSPGTCTVLQKCSAVFEKVKTKKISLRSLQICGFEGKDPIVCCENSNGIQPNFTRSGDTSRPAEIACDRYTKNALKALHFNIISGIPAKAGEFPHMAAMAFSTIGGSGFEFKCGASLISENYALTAAHCVNRPDLHPLFLRLGKLTLTLDLDDLDSVDVGVDRVILHPEYKVSLVYHDIALLKLNQSVEFGPFVRPICLYTNTAPFAKGTILTVTGWGKTTFAGGSFNDVLLKANLTQVDTSECNQTYTNNGTLERRMRFGIRSEGQLCAFGKEDQDACQGDSGGPLQIVLEEGSSIQVGIVSFGSGCGLLPGVYTKVADYLDWIESQVWPR